MGSRGYRTIVSRTALSLLASALVPLCLPAVAGAATLTVTTTDWQSATDCTLSDAITAANLNGDWGECTGTGPYGTDSIEVTAAGTMALPNSGFGLPSLTSSMSITGPGTEQLEIRRENGPNAFRIFEITLGDTVSISSLTLSNGRVTQIGAGGGGISNLGDLTLDRVDVIDNHVEVQSASQNPAVPGGGISSLGPLTLRRTTVAGNSVTNAQTAATGSRSALADGGGITAQSTLTIERSTIADNTVSASVATSDPSVFVLGRGGGVHANGPTSISLSTISGNRVSASAPASPNAAQNGLAATRGGGLHTADQTTLTSTTIASNGTDVNAPLAGANIWAEGTETATNTILAYPVGGANCAFGFEADGGGNLVFPTANSPDPPACGLAAPVTADPLLGPLADNGGPTETRAVPLASPAVDAGVNSGETSDQRELARPVNRPEVANSNPAASAYDIGAFELQPDTDAPDTTIDSFRVESRRRKATFRFSSDEPGSTFECRLDGGGFDLCVSPTTFRRLGKGRHRFEVRAVDPSGNADPNPAVQRFRIKP